jgi:uncharacterized Zn finger protein
MEVKLPTHKHAPPYDVTRRAELCLCPTCSGTGKIHQSELTNYHKSEYRTWTDPCTRCNETGRVWMKVTIEEVVFDANGVIW